MRGKRIINLHGLWLARQDRKSVICPTSRAWEKPRPAAFMMNLPGEILLRLFKGGMYLYKKGKSMKKTILILVVILFLIGGCYRNNGPVDWNRVQMYREIGQGLGGNSPTLMQYRRFNVQHRQAHLGGF